MKLPMPCWLAKRRTRKNQTPKQEGALVNARELDVVFRQPVGELGLDDVRHYGALAALRRLQLAGDGLIRHHHFRDPVVGEQLFELTIGHHLDGLDLVPPLLHEQHGEERKDQVSDVDLGVLLHRRRAPRFAR